jgi:hypothetical protein
MDHEKNFITSNVTPEDEEQFFGPIEEDDEFVLIEEHWTMSHVMKAAGVFSSTSEARRNGWDRPIPDGFSIFAVGKKNRRHVYIFNKKEQDAR